MLSAIVIIWVALLLFFGMMVTHDYSLRKAVLAQRIVAVSYTHLWMRAIAMRA